MIMSKEVRFGSIVIREYTVVLGDNPACQSGPPLSLDWTYHCTGEVFVDDYESSRAPRKSQDDLYLSDSIRWMMLLEKHSPVEVDAVVQQVARLQRLRGESARAANKDAKHVMKEDMKVVVEMRPSSKHEKKYLKNLLGRIVKSKKSSTLKSRLERRRTLSVSVSTEDSTASIETDDYDLLDDSVMDDGRDYTHSVEQEGTTLPREQPEEEVATTFEAETLEI